MVHEFARGFAFGWRAHASLVGMYVGAACWLFVCVGLPVWTGAAVTTSLLDRWK